MKEYRNIIIYCNTRKEGRKINVLLNTLQKKSSEYIDSSTPKKKRREIIEKYKSGVLPFLVNVRVLVEGFDAPITKGVCFMHLPSSKTTIIQIIGRALRLNEEKTYATIILPFSSKEDETSITNFMKIIAKNDKDVLPLQCFSAFKLVKDLGYPLGNIYGHGEINNHKANTEGQKCKTFIKDNWDLSIDEVANKVENI